MISILNKKLKIMGSRQFEGGRKNMKNSKTKNHFFSTNLDPTILTYVNQSIYIF